LTSGRHLPAATSITAVIMSIMDSHHPVGADHTSPTIVFSLLAEDSE
jgi:hypothetical protein